MKAFFSKKDFLHSKSVKKIKLASGKELDIAPACYWFDIFGNEVLTNAIIEDDSLPPNWQDDFVFVGYVTRYSRPFNDKYTFSKNVN